MNHFEIEACIIRAKNGSREELLKILEQYKPFIFKTAATFNIKDHDLYDMVQIGYVTLINAVAKYKIGAHNFSSYAYNAIKNNFKYTARQNSKRTGEVSLNLPVSEPGLYTLSYVEYIECIDSLENMEEDLIKAENIKELRRAVSKLPSEELELIIMVYYSKCSLKTYAEKKGLTYLQASRRRKKALEKLNFCLSK